MCRPYMDVNGIENDSEMAENETKIVSILSHEMRSKTYVRLTYGARNRIVQASQMTETRQH